MPTRQSTGADNSSGPLQGTSASQHSAQLDPIASIESLRAAVATIAQIDLTAINLRLIEKLDWSSETSAQVEAAYRRFLVLSLLHPAECLVPTKEVDEFWHMHILDTRAYQRDCLSSLGYFLHHEPSDVGELNEDASLAIGYQRTRFLENHYFSVNADGHSAKCQMEGGSRCVRNSIREIRHLG